MSDFTSGLLCGLSLGLLIGAIGVAFVGSQGIKAIRSMRHGKAKQALAREGQGR